MIQSNHLMPNGDAMRPKEHAKISRRQLLSALMPALALPLGLSSCSQTSPIKVGLHPWIGYETLNMAESFHLLGAQVQLVRGDSATSSLEGLENGSLDAAALTLDEVLLARHQGIPLVVVMVFDISAGADQIIAKPSIKSPEDLRGKRIGYEETALGALMLKKFLDRFGLKSNEIDPVYLPVGSMQLDYWQTDQIDAVISYEPTASELRALGGKVLFDSRAIPETIFDVLAVRADRLETYDEQLKNLIQMHFKSLEHIITNRGDAMHRIAALQNISTKEVQLALSGIRLPNRVINYRLLADDGRISKVADEISKLMFADESPRTEHELPPLTTQRFLPR